MSMRYKGSVISATPPVLATDAGASGAWTLEQQMQAKAAGKWPKNGPFNWIEDVFSTYLYTGNSSTQTITNGIDLAGKGGLVWLKGRSLAVGHYLYDTNRGIANGPLSSENTNEAYTANTPKTLTTFNSDGFSMQDDSATFGANVSPRTQVSWTFRKQPKFFDTATYTTVSGAMTIPHNLGSVPGCWIIKSTSAGSAAPDWWVFHRSIPGQLLRLNGTSAVESGFSTATSTNITISNGVYGVGETLVIYIFAHNAGGFGLSGNENVISCGSYTGSAGTTTVNVGFEPQWLMIKKTNADASWKIVDNMRGFFAGPESAGAYSNVLFPNTSGAESVNSSSLYTTPTGFNVGTYTSEGGAGNTFIYIAIRRGPMAVPTDGTKVYNAIARTGTGAAATVTGVGFTPDWLFTKSRSNVTGSMVADRLRGAPFLQTTNTNEETTNTAVIDSTAFSTTMDGFRLSASSTLNNWSPYTYINYLFKRAPSFFDEVMLNSSTTTYTHNLTVAPELIFVKCRDAAGANWVVYSKSLPSPTTEYLNLNNTNSTQTHGVGAWSVSSTQFSVAVGLWANGSTGVAYLFASAPGVSKVGSYTGTGTTQAIACGFTTGARFIMIKRTDTVGDWYVWDSVRGIVAGDDPFLFLNSTAAEVTNTDFVDTSAAGFELSSTAPASINASGGSYIFLAIS